MQEAVESPDAAWLPAETDCHQPPSSPQPDQRYRRNDRYRQTRPPRHSAHTASCQRAAEHGLRQWRLDASSQPCHDMRRSGQRQRQPREICSRSSRAPQEPATGTTDRTPKPTTGRKAAVPPALRLFVISVWTATSFQYPIKSRGIHHDPLSWTTNRILRL